MRKPLMRRLTAWLWALGALGAALSLGPPVRAQTTDTVGLGVRANTGPPAPVTDLAASSAVEWQATLQWTTPDENAFLPTGVGASSYVVRAATFSVDSVGADTTAWWNAAGLRWSTGPARAIGSLESFVSSGFIPGATYYFAVRSYDELSFISAIDTRAAVPGLQAKAVIFDAVPPAPAGLAVTGVGNSSVSLSWNPVAAADLHQYRIYFDSVPPYDFASSTSIALSSDTLAYTHSGLTPYASYYYYVTALDQGASVYPGVVLESPPSNIVNALPIITAVTPQEPYGVGLQYTSSTAVLAWMPVRHFSNGVSFLNSAAPSNFELSGYRVYRATAPVKVNWTQMAALSTSTLTWTDLAGGPQYYYHVKAENTGGLSFPSMIRAHGGPAWLLGYDTLSTFEIPEKWLDELIGVGGNPDTAYLLKTSSHTQDISAKVLKSIEFSAWRGGAISQVGMALEGIGHLHLHYAFTGSSVAPSGLGLGPAAALNPDPESLSIFWFNGIKWVQMYGKLDAVNQVMNVETKYLGQYQLRVAERVTDFNFNPAGLSNRMITPNGDGKNDAVEFKYDNPRASAVSGKVLDIKGSFVATMTQCPDVADCLRWDAASGGRVVPGGVYIYQIEAEGRTFTGTVIVIK